MLSGKAFFALLAPLVLCLAASATADYSMTQTNWYGGDGNPGPVTAWGDDFNSCSDVVYYVTEGELILGNSFITPVKHDISGGMDDVAAVWSADLNGDGQDDLVTANEGDGRIIWWRNNGGTWWPVELVDDLSGANSVCTLDADGDGDQDIAAVSGQTDMVLLWLNLDGAGTYWTEIEVENGFNGGNCVYPADINGDGHMDMVGSAMMDQDIVWWQNVGGTGTDWIKRTIDSNFGYPSAVAAADIDGDGNVDVVASDNSYYSGKVAWWRNIGGGGNTWSETQIDSSLDGYDAVAVGDVNQDSYIDVLACSYYDDEILWLQNVNGSGTSWSAHTISGSFNGAEAVTTADFDSDGDLDVLGAASQENTVAWFENVNRVGTSWITRNVNTSFSGACGVAAGDFDGNENQDVAAVASSADELKWWEVVGFAPDGQLTSSILDTEMFANYKFLYWDTVQPEGTNVYFKLRSSNNPGNMGSWSDPIESSGDLVDIPIARYVQYQMFLESSDYKATPVVSEVELTWIEISDIARNAGAVSGFALHDPVPNPSMGSSTLGFSVPGVSRVSLEVYDCSGRLVSRLVDEELGAGLHQAQISDLGPGLYLCRLTAGGEVATRSLVVIH